ncbi:MAG: PQQ-dependent sugar dehydrogenase [Acidobacteriota bacterium]
MIRGTLEYSWRFTATFLLAATAAAAGGPPPIPDVRLVDAFPGIELDRPLWLTHAGDGSGRFFVLEQEGRIRILRPASASQAKPGVFLDISSSVRTVHNEEGLLALAFATDYAKSGAFYVFHSASDPRRSILARYHVKKDDPDAADPASREVLLEVEKPYGNHNGSTVLFGPDGDLYLSLGDGGGGGDPLRSGQNLAVLLGKILRIDVAGHDPGLAYAIPRDNPFVATKGVRPEIWAYGLRNVWRMSFDAKTGDLWAGDVGQDSWEEIDLIEKGGNYGWNLREGTHPFKGGAASASFAEPVIDYGRKDGASVTGGYVYRGEKQKGLQGVYLYADFVTGSIWGLRHVDGKVVAQRRVLEQPKNIASFGQGPDGELYVCAFDGHVYHVEEVPAR